MNKMETILILLSNTGHKATKKKKKNYILYYVYVNMTSIGATDLSIQLFSNIDICTLIPNDQQMQMKNKT